MKIKSLFKAIMPLFLIVICCNNSPNSTNKSDNDTYGYLSVYYAVGFYQDTTIESVDSLRYDPVYSDSNLFGFSFENSANWRRCTNDTINMSLSVGTPSRIVGTVNSNVLKETHLSFRVNYEEWHDLYYDSTGQGSTNGNYGLYLEDTDKVCFALYVNFEEFRIGGNLLRIDLFRGSTLLDEKQIFVNYDI